MTETIVVSLISLIGTLGGSLSGILVSNKLSNYRIEQLEKKVAAHNNLIERTYKLEQSAAVFETKEELLEHKIEDIESAMRKTNKD